MSLPSEQKLAAVSERMIFLKACRMALAEAQRVQCEVVQSLVAQAGSLGRNHDSEHDSEESVRSPLYVQLGLAIQQTAAQLQGLLDEAAALVASLGIQGLARGGADVMAVLPQLRALRIITAEEELLEFVQVCINDVIFLLFLVLHWAHFSLRLG